MAEAFMAGMNAMRGRLELFNAPLFKVGFFTQFIGEIGWFWQGQLNRP
jgi:hypothetical protein